MASTSEKGHAKNLANANKLNTYIAELGTTYKPSNPKLLLTNLQATYTTSFTHQQNVNNLVAPYTIAVDNREAIFIPISKKMTKLHKVYKATEDITKAQLEDFMTIVRKLRGIRKSSNTTQEQTKHSTSQMSYDQRANNFDLLISLLQNTPNYNPNEVEYKIATLQVKKAQMLQATQNVIGTYIPLNKARSIRNHSMYLSNDSLINIFNKAKNYLFAILDTNSVQYKAISKIKFKKIGV